MFENIISLENICAAWREFLLGKKLKKDVAAFSLRLSSNLFALHEDLKNNTYEHGSYKEFNISDPKPRIIHKASVRDRVLHHAIYRVLYPYFDRKFISDAYSCRDEKGTHRAMRRFKHFARKVSKNNTRTCWVLKCDIKKFFASVDQEKLLRILQKHILDRDTLWLLGKVITSFKTVTGKGLPLGNFTSQLLVNVYMNEFDKYVKHELRFKCYVRYADDFVFLSEDKTALQELIPAISSFLKEELKLSLHPNKVFIKSWASGVDFLGWIHFPYHSILRTSTKRRMMKNIQAKPEPAVLISYCGLLSHGNTFKLRQELENAYGLFRDSYKDV